MKNPVNTPKKLLSFPTMSNVPSASVTKVDEKIGKTNTAAKISGKPRSNFHFPVLHIAQTGRGNFNLTIRIHSPE